MIAIHNLTTEQHEICEKLFNCETLDEVSDFISSLPKNKQPIAKSLQQMLIYATIDSYVETEDDCKQAIELLKNIKSK